MSKVFTCLGDRNRASSYLEKAQEVCDPDLIELRVEPLFDELRSDRRFADLMRRLPIRVDNQA